MQLRFAPTALTAALLLVGCGGSDESTGPTQITLPFALESTAAGVAVRSDGTVVVADVGKGSGFATTWSFTNSDWTGGQILELAPDATEPEQFATKTLATPAIALFGDDLYAGEYTFTENDPATSSDDVEGFQIRVYHNDTSTIIPFDLTNGGSSSNDDAYAIAVSPAGDIYVCAGSVRGSFGDLLRLGDGQSAPELIDPMSDCSDGLAFNSNGDLYTLGNSILVKYPGGDGEPDGVWMPEVTRPVRFAIGADDAIYVADNGIAETGQRIVRFTDGSDAATTIPLTATVEGYHDMAVAPNGDVVLTDDNLVFRLSPA